MNLANYQYVAYIVLAVIFVSVISYMFWYNLRLKNRQKSLEGGGRHMGTEEGIAAATESELRSHRDHKHRH
jgi:hypothetical protein